MTDYLLLLLAALLLAFDFALSKLYQQHVGTTLSAGFLFNVFSGLFTALIFWAIGGFAFHFSNLYIIHYLRVRTELDSDLIFYSD